MRRVGLILCLLWFPVLLSGQDLRRIKENPSFLWGEGTGKDYESMQASAVDALIRKLSTTNLIDIPAGHESAVWKTYRNDILSVSEVVWDSGTALRYIAWKDVGRIFSRRKKLSGELSARAAKACSAGESGEAATCLDWAQALLEVLPEDTAAKASVKAMRKKPGDSEPTAVPGLSYVGREVEQIRKALGKSKTSVSAQIPRAMLSETEAVPVQRSEIPLHAPVRVPEEGTLPARQDVPRQLFQPRETVPSMPGEEAPVKYISAVRVTVSPSLGGGLFLGLKKRQTGGYLSFGTGFQTVREDYACTRDGRTDFGHIWASGRSRYSSFSLSGGIIVGNSGGLAGYAGAGYGRVGCYWEDVSGQWAKVEDRSFQGILVESGLIWTAGKLVVTAGLSSVSFSTLSPVIGLGVCF